MRKFLLLVAVASLGASAAFASAGKPSSAEARRVIEYYYTGKAEGPLLVDSVLCLKVDTAEGSASRHNCVEKAGETVPNGTSVAVWTMWMVPSGGSYDDVMIQFLHDGVTRSTMDLPLTSSVRYRTYRRMALSKAGNWEVKVMRGAEELSKHTVTVE